jgi:hypothetical protein
MTDLSKSVGEAAEPVKNAARDAARRGGQIASQAREYAADVVSDGTGRAVNASTGAVNELSGHVRAFPFVSAMLILGGFLAGCLLTSARR